MFRHILAGTMTKLKRRSLISFSTMSTTTANINNIMTGKKRTTTTTTTFVKNNTIPRFCLVSSSYTTTTATSSCHPLLSSVAAVVQKNNEKNISAVVTKKRPLSTTTITTTASTTTTTTISHNNNNKPIALFLNASRLDYDNQLDFSKIEEIVTLHRNNQDKINDTNDIIQLVNDIQPEILILKEMILPAECITKFPSTIKLICEAGTGFNNIPIHEINQYNKLNAATENNNNNITVCNVPTYSTDAVAHMAITYIMNFSINMFQQQEMLKYNNDKSNFTGPFTLQLNELNNSTLGLVGGLGRIGSKVGEIALSLGMKLIISTRSPCEISIKDTHPIFYNNNNVKLVSTSKIQNDLLPYCDYVSLHTPLNNKTRNTFGYNEFISMKSTAYFINTSRGGVVNENELIQALTENVISGAGLDVTTTEPPSLDSKIWNLHNVYLTPHIGWRRIETRQRLIDMTYDNIYAYCTASSENDYINVVN